MNSGNFFAMMAELHSQTCTPEENEIRKKNGRRSNVGHVFEEEDAKMFLDGAGGDGEENEEQTIAFGVAVFAFA